MQRKKYRKLVRDKIPALITETGDTPVTRTLSKEAFRHELRRKLVEEAEEVRNANGLEALIAELADVEEVLSAICAAYGIECGVLTGVRKQRARARGVFENKIFLCSVKQG